MRSAARCDQSLQPTLRAAGFGRPLLCPVFSEKLSKLKGRPWKDRLLDDRCLRGPKFPNGVATLRAVLEGFNAPAHFGAIQGEHL